MHTVIQVSMIDGTYTCIDVMAVSRWKSASSLGKSLTINTVTVLISVLFISKSFIIKRLGTLFKHHSIIYTVLTSQSTVTEISTCRLLIA